MTLVRSLILFVALIVGLQVVGADSAQARPSRGWTYCAQEGGTCYVPGPATVRYGANGRYSTVHTNGPVSCSNAVFGDPIYGVVKSCDYRLDYDGPTGPGDGAGWQYCAEEDQMCYVPYYTTVRYGVPGRYAYIQTQGNVRCSNSVFGDPAYGQRKSCFIQVRY